MNSVFSKTTNMFSSYFDRDTYKIESDDEFDEPPCILFELCGDDDVKELSALLDENESFIHLRNKHNYTLLHYAISHGSIDCATMLIERGIDVNAVDRFHETALHFAASCLQFDIVPLLIRNGANIHAKDDIGRTPLHSAHRSKKMFNYLIAYGANPEEPNIHGITPMMDFISYGINDDHDEEDIKEPDDYYN